MFLSASKLSAAAPGVLFGFAAFLGSFLLFQLELLAGQTVLPHYGGSYYVWTVCLLFYQTALVAGYAYALFLSERFPPKILLRGHLVLLAAALVFMPTSFPAQAFENPVLDLLWRLTRFIAFPFLLLSASTTLCHKLLSDASGRNAYSVFAWSNAGSLAGMLSYSLLLEPGLPLVSIALLWRIFFIIYALFFAVFMQLGLRGGFTPANAAAAGKKQRYLLWFILPAGSAALLASVSGYQSSVTASMPLTWMIPLTVYLLSYAMLFSGVEPRVNTLRICLFSLLFALAWLLWRFESSLTTILLTLLNWALFFACIVAHRELYLSRPRSAALAPRYYLMIGLGGVAGTALVTPIGALRLSFGFADLYIALIAFVGALAYAVNRERGLGLRAMGFSTALLACLLALGLKLSGETQVFGLRNFYGIYRVEDDKTRSLRRFVHGSTVHGIQYLAAGKELETTVYYSSGSPISEILTAFPAARVGAVGLGIGVSCAYARKGTEWVFYELDPDVADIALKYFTFLEKCQADVRIVTGDARINLQKEPSGRFDLLYMDAFSGGSAPLHLLTREALELYRSRLKPGGLMIFHVSANFLDLVPVLRLSASAAGLQSLAKTVSFDPDDPARLSSEWLAVTANPAHLRRLAKTGWSAPAVPAGWQVWTDEYRNVLKAIKW